LTGLSHFTPLLALAVYPTAFFLGFAINPIEFRWGANQARNGRAFGAPMPQRLQDRSDAVTRYLNFLVDALVLAPIVGMSRAMGLGFARIGLQLASWKHDAAFGIAFGVLSIAVMGLLLRRVPIDPRHPFTYRVRKGSPLLWLFVFITGAFSEELWIAFCLVAFRTTGYSAAASVLMTVAVFAAVHYSYHFWGALAVAVKGTVSAMLFLHFGSLVVTFLYHFVGNLGSLYWNRYWRR
jgi:Type II CAAX prenyl endopeptidase Rce1-like